jgi:hypothetical protein
MRLNLERTLPLHQKPACMTHSNHAVDLSSHVTQHWAAPPVMHFSSAATPEPQLCLSQSTFTHLQCLQAC